MKKCCVIYAMNIYSNGDGHGKECMIATQNSYYALHHPDNYNHAGHNANECVARHAKRAGPDFWVEH